MCERRKKKAPERETGKEGKKGSKDLTSSKRRPKKKAREEQGGGGKRARRLWIAIKGKRSHLYKRKLERSFEIMATM